MNDDLGRIKTYRATGGERFRDAASDLGFDLLSFWQWSTSDVVSNVTRGRLAEYLVARAVGLGVDDIREEWAAYDIKSPEGIKIEVKSAAYIQSWAQEKHSIIQFGYKKTRGWDADTNTVSKEAQRHADVYVLALLFHIDQATLNPLDVAQWLFFVVPTPVFDARIRSQHSITLRSLQTLTGDGVRYSELRNSILQVIAENVGPDV
jgi:hypothetical protein